MHAIAKIHSRLLMIVWVAVASLSASHAHCQPEVEDPETTQPNIIIFLIDDMGWTDTSVPFHTETTTLNERYHTPHMARLASQGVMFTQAYATAVCSPTRVSLMTGMNAARHGVTNWTLHKDRSPDWEHPRVQPPDWPLNGLSPNPGIDRTVVATCLPELLRDAGYHTIHVGKAHLGAVGTPGADPTNLGFDVNIGGHAAGGPGSYLGIHDFSAAWRSNGGERVWDVPHLEEYHGKDIYLNEALTRETIKVLDSAIENEKPFFLHLSHYAIHAPWEADPRFLPHYQQQGLTGLPAAYASMIESMDKSLGDILDWLAENNQDQNTLFIFVTDNGAPSQAPRNRPLRGHKLTPYEGGIRVPMIVRWPGHTEPGTRNSTPLITEDIFTTVLQAAGVHDPETQQTVDGVSFAPLLDGTDVDGRRALLWHFPHNFGSPPWSAVRIGDWKLIWHYDDQRAELYNLAEDLSESDNLAEPHVDKLAELSTLLRQKLAECNALLPISKQTGETLGLPSGPGH